MKSRKFCFCFTLKFFNAEIEGALYCRYYGSFRDEIKVDANGQSKSVVIDEPDFEPKPIRCNPAVIDQISAYSFPTCFTLFNIVYWNYYLHWAETQIAE